MKRVLCLMLAFLLGLTALSVGALAGEDAAVVVIGETLTEPAAEAAAGDAEPAGGGPEERQASEAPVPEDEMPLAVESAYVSDAAAQDPGEARADLMPPGGEDAPAEAGAGTEMPAADAMIIDSEGPAYTVSGEGILLENGVYSYALVIKETGELTFDNDLAISYQGVDGRYSLHYEIEGSGSHIMIVNGTFENILTTSPLTKRLRGRVSRDVYSYQLDLRTSEGFSFANSLQYLCDGNPRGYSLHYSYDLAANSQTLILKLQDRGADPQRQRV